MEKVDKEWLFIAFHKLSVMIGYQTENKTETFFFLWENLFLQEVFRHKKCKQNQMKL